MRPEGLEPPTSWSVAKRSIQLSYGRLFECSSVPRRRAEPSQLVRPSAFPNRVFRGGDLSAWLGGQGRARRRTVSYAARSAVRSPTTPGAEDPPRKCPRQDSNLYAVSGTGPSNQPVYQFQHVGKDLHVTNSVTNARRGTRTLTGLTPTGS